jgi:RNA polymerase-binding transcription factor DksA
MPPTEAQRHRLVPLGRTRAEETGAAHARPFETPDRFRRCAGTDREIRSGRLEVVPWTRTGEEAAT